MPIISTKSDPLLNEKVLTDEVTQIRVWGTSIVKPLDRTDDVKRIIGLAPGSWLRIQDTRVSKAHAEVVYDSEHERWMLRDLGSTNGIVTGRVRYGEIVLEPGMEVLVGGVALVAESDRFAHTRVFLSRILGRSAEQATAVEAAVRSLRLAATYRKEIVLCGNDDMVSLARSLHRRFLGPDRPFVVCDPSRESLCIRKAKEASAFDTTAILVPTLELRKAELPEVIQEYGVDAMRALEVPLTSFKKVDVEWVLANESAQLADIEKATRRLVALRASDGNMSRAAALLGMARMSLRKWIRKRRLPITLVDDRS
jgi:hypothetical protein